MEKLIKKHYKKIVILIFLLGIIIRTIYVVKNPIRKNQYDCKIWDLYKIEDYKGVYEQNEKNIGVGGHLYYIMTIYNKMQLPDGIGGQYYHPPLHHFISAMWLKVMDLLPLDEIQKIESLQTLSLLYSAIILLLCYAIIEKTKINEIGKILTYILINFFSMFIYMSGFINNDLLITLFILASLYFLIKWNEEPNIKNTVLISLSMGLGMMTKTSIAIMMLPIVIIVFLKLVEFIKNKKKIGKIILEILIFSLIAGSLSMWYQIRNHIKYDADLFMIQQPYEHFYAGDASFWERWGFTSEELIKNSLSVDDKSILGTVLNSSLFCLDGEDSFYCYMLKEVVAVLAIIAIFEMFKKVIKPDKNERILLITFATWVLGFIAFNVSLPYSCTMNARYIPILFIIAMIMDGYAVSESKYTVVKCFVYTLSIILSVFSIIVIV